MSQKSPTKSRKRPRTIIDDEDDEDLPTAPVLPSPATPGEVRHHSDLWFDDGNVVFVGTDNTGFRLHRSILSRHSAIFRDMFSMPQPATVGSETLEGCPVVHLQDSSEDLAFLLTALYDGRKNSYFNRELSVTFAAVSAMLRLGSKYEVDHIRDDAIFRLKLCFPSSLSEYDSSLHVNCQQPPISDISTGDAICVVNLARRFDLNAILPIALYTCCQLDNRSIIKGITYPNGTTEKLTTDDVLLCLDSRDTLLQDNTTNTAFLCAPTASDSCIHTSICIRGMRSLIRTAQKEEIFARDDPLKNFHSFLVRHASEVGICEPCVEYMASQWRKGRARTWKGLGKLFKVKDWPPAL